MVNDQFFNEQLDYVSSDISIIDTLIVTILKKMENLPLSVKIILHWSKQVSIIYS